MTMLNIAPEVEAQHTTAPVQHQEATLNSMVVKSVEGYLDQLSGTSVSNLYDLICDEIREPLLRTVLKKLRGNQSAAARLMGISRGTLRKLMKRYGMLD